MPLLRLPWPLSALIVWACAWLVFVLLQSAGWPVAALLGGCLLGTAGSLLGHGWWRRGLIALGFPLSLALLGAARLPISAWLGALVLLLWVYPLNAWRDARYGCTPRQALQRLALPQLLQLHQPPCWPPTQAQPCPTPAHRCANSHANWVCPCSKSRAVAKKAASPKAMCKPLPVPLCRALYKQELLRQVSRRKTPI